MFCQLTILVSVLTMLISGVRIWIKVSGVMKMGWGRDVGYQMDYEGYVRNFSVSFHGVMTCVMRVRIKKEGGREWGVGGSGVPLFPCHSSCVPFKSGPFCSHLW